MRSLKAAILIFLFVLLLTPNMYAQTSGQTEGTANKSAVSPAEGSANAGTATPDFLQAQ